MLDYIQSVNLVAYICTLIFACATLGFWALERFLMPKYCDDCHKKLTKMQERLKKLYG